MPTISNIYVQTFEKNIRHLAQQSQSKLRGTVREVSKQSENHAWERIGVVDAEDKVGRLVPTPVADSPFSRRMSAPTTFHAGDSTEQEDPVQMLVDPNSAITQALSMAMRRGVDDKIINAATADALTEGGGISAFPASQVAGDGTGVISFDLITEVQEIFMKNDIDPEVPKVAVVGPTQVRKLMQLTENTSSDYVRAQQLQQYGIAPNWLGFNWINSTRLLSPTGDGSDISCLFYTNRAIGLQVNRDISARVQEDPSVSFAWRLYSFATMGAVRVEDEHIVHGHLLDAMS